MKPTGPTARLGDIGPPFGNTNLPPLTTEGQNIPPLAITLIVQTVASTPAISVPPGQQVQVSITAEFDGTST